MVFRLVNEREKQQFILRRRSDDATKKGENQTQSKPNEDVEMGFEANLDGSLI